MQNQPSESKLVQKGIHLPKAVFDSRILGNWHAAPTAAEKSQLVRAWFESSTGPIAIDTATKYGAGLALQVLNKHLCEQQVAANRLIAIHHLGWYPVPSGSDSTAFDRENWLAISGDAELRLSPEGIRQCWQHYTQQTSDNHRARMLSLQDVTQYLSLANNSQELASRKAAVIDTFAALKELASDEHPPALGMHVGNRRIFEEVDQHITLDWVMVSGVAALAEHSAADAAWLTDLASRGIAVIEAAPFGRGDSNARGSSSKGLSQPSAEKSGLSGRAQGPDWPQQFAALCLKHEIHPAAAQVQFSLRHPAVSSVVLPCSVADRVDREAGLATASVPKAFWVEAKLTGLVSEDW